MAIDTGKERELTGKTIGELSELLKKREVSSRDLAELYFKAIEGLNPKLNCYVLKTFDRALTDADAADRRIANDENVTALTGVPIALKDIFITEGIRTTCCSKILHNYIPPFDGTPARKLKDAGSVLLGKLNMDEFAMGASNENSCFGPVKNPWDLERVSGGSSGGSAAAVAARLCAGSLGTDTGGSIRQPASFCGLVGIKPTYGRVSRFGVVAFASSLDQVGPIARDVTDCAILLGAIAGHDSKDSTSIPTPVPDYRAALNGSVKGKIIGIPKEYFIHGIDSEVELAVREAARALEKLGAKVEEISLPHTKYAVPCYYIIAPAEASSNLARYDGIRYGYRAKDFDDLPGLYMKSRSEGFGPEVSLRIIIGTYVLSSGYYDAYYTKAQKVRSLIKQDFVDAFKTCDAIITPTAPTPPFKIGENIDDPVKMYLSDVFTAPVNLSGLPGISVPCGFSKGGLPIGMQLIGKPLDEANILNIAYSYEQTMPWHKMEPGIIKSQR